MATKRTEPIFTHTQACAMVQSAIERCLSTLLHCQEQLNQGKPKTLATDLAVSEANLLCNINYYGAYMHGAQAMLRTLIDGYFTAQNINTKAILNLALQSRRNLDYFLHGTPEGVEIRIKYQRNKKGKAVSAEAVYVKKETNYTEI